MKKVTVKPKKVSPKKAKCFPSEKIAKATKEELQSIAELQDFIKKMKTDSDSEAERARDTVSSLGERSALKVDPAEAYGYTKFPAPIADYLDYIKSTKNNLKSWEDLKSFLTTTDTFWKVMRDQSLKIAIDFAKKKRVDTYNYQLASTNEWIVKCPFRDKSYYREIIDGYTDELEKEKIITRSHASELFLKLILGYSEHESEIEDSVKNKECSVIERVFCNRG